MRKFTSVVQTNSNPEIMFLGLIVTFRVRMGLLTNIRDSMENSGEEFFAKIENSLEQRLNSNYDSIEENREF